MSEKTKIKCWVCKGTGHHTEVDIDGKNVEVKCLSCKGRGYDEWEKWGELND